MEIAVFWFAGAFVVGIIASSKGRSGLGYFLLSIVLSPVLAGILAIALPSLNGPQTVVAVDAATPDTHVKCPDCRELVIRDARKCKHCGTALIPQ